MSEPATPSKKTAPLIVQELPILIARMHRRFLDVLRIELTRLGINDMSPVQAIMLANIGQEEISVRDLIERGYYLGSNASYNLKGLVDSGYVDRQAAARDRRSALLKVSVKGQAILEALTRLNGALTDPLLKQETDIHDLESSYRTLRRLERRWSDSIRFADQQDDEDI